MAAHPSVPAKQGPSKAPAPSNRKPVPAPSVANEAVPQADQPATEPAGKARLVVNGRPAVTLDPFVPSEIALAYPTLRQLLRDQTMRVAAQRLSDGGWQVFIYPLATASHEPLFDDPSSALAFITSAIRFDHA